MVSPDILDFQHLLAPIPGENPAGPDLRLDTRAVSNFMLLKDARRLARSLEREQEAAPVTMDRSNLLPEWRPVLDLAQRVIAEESKDMEVAAWLIEVLGRAHGFAGLRDGFRLAAGLAEQFWGGLHSVEGDDGLPDRVAPLAALNGLGSEGPLPAVVRRIPITDIKGGGPFALWQYQQATRPPVSPDEATRAQIQTENQAMLEQMVQSARESGAAYYRTLIDDIEACQTRFGELEAVLDVKCGPDSAPPGANVRNVLGVALDAVRDLARDLVLRVQEAAIEPTESTGPADGAAAGGSEADGTQAVPVVSTGSLRSREEAFRTLLAVADFFRRSEPHSPISYTLEEVVRRGRMPLPDLLEELIPDESARHLYLQAAGIKPPSTAG